MKYMIEYQIRNAGLSHDQNLTNQEALINAFGKWKPEEGLTVHAFVSNLANGGYVLVEAAEPGVVQSFVSKFIYWNDVEVVARGGRHGGGHNRLRVTCVGPRRVERLRYSLPPARAQPG